MKKLIPFALVGLCGLAALVPSTASAAVNVSFENPQLTGGGAAYAYFSQPFGNNPSVPAGFAAIPGVTFSGASGIQANGSAFGFSNAPDGTQTAFIQSYHGVGGAISVDLTNLVVGQRYFVTFSAARRGYSDPNGASNPFSVSVGGHSNPFDTSSTTFSPFTTSFIAQNTTDSLIFTGSANGGDATLGLDAISVAVPEPATWAMMLMGFGMVGAGVRSRRKPTVKLTYA